MSEPISTSSRASEDLPSPRSGRASEPSASVRTIPFAEECSPTEIQASQSTEISESSMEECIEDEPISQQEDFLANLGAASGIKEARKMTATSSEKWREFVEKRSQLSSFSKMFMGSSRMGSTRCSLSWRAWDSPRKHLLLALLPSMLRTGGTGFGFLPTPVATDFKGAASPEARKRKGRSSKNSLPDAVEFQGQVGRLSPIFVESLMGYPIGHTESEPLAMQSCRK